jgi:hypothetical protein
MKRLMKRSFKIVANQLIIPIILLLLQTSGTAAQQSPDSVEVIAGKQYDRSAFHQWLFGSHYRQEWATPVKLPVVNLDTIMGGLVPYKTGGGRQSRSLRLKDKNDREYVIRSIEKSYGKALPEIAQGTFIEDFINDQVSIAHPYSSVTISEMAQSGGIFHTIPSIAYIPIQNPLDSFNNEYGNRPYTLEQRPDEDWEGAENFGNSKKIVSTEKMLEKTLNSNEDMVDQKAYARARLFDFLIGDWGRHEDQWRWATFDTAGTKRYVAIPRDRDQAYTKFDGVLLKAIIGAADLKHLQTFKDDIHDIKRFNFPARNLDHRFTNELTRQDWIEESKKLQEKITDAVIESSVRKMPREVYPISGETIIRNLKSRRNHLADYAEKYYDFLAKEVDIPATSENDFIKVTRLNNKETNITLFRKNKKGETDEKPYYNRTFIEGETDEVRVYGINGNDVFSISGEIKDGIKLRLIGGPQPDSFIDRSNGEKVHIYDDAENIFQFARETKKHLSDDTAIHSYLYNSFRYDRSKFVSGFSYSYADRLYFRVGYQFINRRWRKEPYGNSQGIYLGYSINQQAFSLIYSGIFRHLFGKINLKLDGNYDAIRWTNFYGLGNETKQIAPKIFYRMISTEGYGSVSLNRDLGKHHNISIAGFYQGVKLIDDRPHLFNEVSFPGDGQLFQLHHFAGGRFDYTVSDVDDPAVPIKGISFNVGTSYTYNFFDADRKFIRYIAKTDIYLPLIWKFGLAIRAGAASLDGDPEFYQFNSIGGSQNLRGYPRDRYWGQTAAYSSNELRWITNFRSYLFNGKFGLIGLYDLGRVWMENEDSEEIHTGYGGGILIAPFNKVSLSVTYGISDQYKLVHIRVNKPL